MADQEYTVRLNADPEGVEKGTASAGASIEAYAKKIAVAAAGVLAASKIFDFLVDSLKSQSESEKAVNSLNLALANQGNYTAAASKDLQDYASALQGVTLYSDETVISAEKTLATFGLLPAQIKQATQAAADYASQTGTDLVSAAERLGRASAGRIASFQREGFVYKANASAAEKYAATIEQITAKYGGGAISAADNFQGSLVKIGNAFDDVKEGVGQVLGAMIDFAGGTNKVIAGLKTVEDFLKNKMVPALNELKAQWDEVFGMMEAKAYESTTKVIADLEKAKKDGLSFEDIKAGGAGNAAMDAATGAATNILGFQTDTLATSTDGLIAKLKEKAGIQDKAAQTDMKAADAIRNADGTTKGLTNATGVDTAAQKAHAAAVEKNAEAVRKMQQDMANAMAHAQIADIGAGPGGDQLGQQLAEIEQQTKEKIQSITDAFKKFGEDAPGGFEKLKSEAVALGDQLTKTAVESQHLQQVIDSDNQVVQNGASFMDSYKQMVQDVAAAEQYAADTIKLEAEAELTLAESKGNTKDATRIKIDLMNMEAQATIRQIAADIQSGKIAESVGIARAEAVAKSTDAQIAAMEKLAKKQETLKKLGGIGELGKLFSSMSSEAGDFADRAGGALSAVSSGLTDFTNATTKAEKGAALFGVAANAIASMLGPNSKVGAALSGAASGAKAGAALGPWGAVIGGVVGGVLGFLKKKKELVIKAAQEAGKSINTAIGDMLSGKGVKDVKSFIPALLKDKKTSMEMFSQLGDQFTEMQGKLKEAVGARVEQGVTGLAAMITHLGSSATATGADFARMGTYAMGLFGAMRKQGIGFVEAVGKMKPALDALTTAAAAKGQTLTGGAADLAGFSALIEKNQELVSAAEGAKDVLSGLRVSGSLTQETFTGLQQDVANYNSELQAQGFSAQQALAIQAPSLYELKKAHDDLGLSLDANTQKQIEAADAAGLFDGMADPIDAMKAGMDAMVQVMAAIATAFHVTLPASVQDYIAAIKSIPPIPGPTGGVPGAPTGSGGGAPPPTVPGGKLPGFARGSGGLRDFDRGTGVVLHGPEAVLTKPQFEGLKARAQGVSVQSSPTIHINGSGLDQSALLAVVKSALRDNSEDIRRDLADAMTEMK